MHNDIRHSSFYKIKTQTVRGTKLNDEEIPALSVEEY